MDKKYFDRPPFNQLNHFWKKLNAERIYFNACGIFRIDRSMLTTVPQTYLKFS